MQLAPRIFKRLSRRKHGASVRRFQRALERERSLHERNGVPFSVLVVAPDPILPENLASRIDAVVRSSDTVGSLPDGRLAVVLACTSAAQAAIVRQALGPRTQLTNLPGFVTLHSSDVQASGGSVPSLEPLLQVETGALRRSMDVLLTATAVVLLAPVMAAVALAIRVDSPGPVLFRQQRVGAGGRPFTFYKFRSMSVDAEARRAALLGHNEQDGPIFKIADDPRITRVGRVLRRLSLDELPQFFNVLKGDMTLVGPRPPLPAEVAEYEPWQLRRLQARGGLTCLWQVSGRSKLGFREWMALDCRYLKDRNPLLDISILLRTFGAVIGARGAC